ncbi:MAG TPA: hypothetical protein VK209_05330 [Candidatus Sulfotelmatobacter sp.]|nr:hypothetical protein [Candidatus Sulfotelmatobacter sp.]
MTDGSLIFKLDEPMVVGAMADGYTSASDAYRGTMFVLGKGTSATTITAGPKTISNGDLVIVEGTVLDTSIAQLGTPTVSEESMGAYMSYIHLQSQPPTNATGVPVSIDAIDPAGTFVHIADVTSDISGSFSYMWKPKTEGQYKITATFAGSPSYGSSFAETAIGVTPAAQQNNNNNSDGSAVNIQDNTNILYGILAAVVVAIILALVAIVVVLRKR